jgi:hypothetical protein
LMVFEPSMSHSCWTPGCWPVLVDHSDLYQLHGVVKQLIVKLEQLGYHVKLTTTTWPD